MGDLVSHQRGRRERENKTSVQNFGTVGLTEALFVYVDEAHK